MGTLEERHAAAEEPTSLANDPVSGVLTGYPGSRVGHTATAGQTLGAAAGILTGYPGDRTAGHVHPGTHGLDDPAAGILTGYVGPRAAHSECGGQGADDPAAGVLTGYPGHRAVGTGTPRTAPTSPHVEATEERS